MTDDPMAEIRASFFVECEELLEALQDGLQLIEQEAHDAETINVVFRAVHSIKGGAGAFGLDGLVRFAHSYETALDQVRSGQMQAGAQEIKIFFQAADHLSDLVRYSREGADLPEDATNKLLSALGELLGEDAAGPHGLQPEPEIDFQPQALALDFDLSGLEGDAALPGLEGLPPLPALDRQKRFEVTFAPQAALFDTGNEPALLLRNLAELGEMETRCDLASLPDLAALSPEQPFMKWQITLKTVAEKDEILSIFEFVEGLCTLDVRELPETEVAPPRPPEAPPQVEPEKVAVPTQPPAHPAPDRATAAAAKSVVRVDIDRIERLVNLVGELVINQAMLSQSLERSGLSPHSDAMGGLEEFQRLTRDIQDSVMMIRAQPVKSLFQRMSRIVREASGSVDKQVRLVCLGETTEVDKTVIERLADPLTHMIRNAVDHGLETAEARRTAGKPAEGRVTLSAAHRSGRVVIEVSDDGAGINRTRVQQIAVEKGLIPADVVLGDTEIDNLLFMPGFSTASTVSALSGRGVGMDVVRTAIQALGGRITINSTPGEGTIFTISLPLTMAILDGMVIEVAEETLVLPLNIVVETLALEDGEVQMVRPGHYVARVRGEFVPLFDLGAALGYRPPKTAFADTVVLLIAQEQGERTALLIDNILDQRQVVIKGLDDSSYRAPGVAAATILGDGQIALILDPADILDTNDRVQPRTTTTEQMELPA
ncbi:MAG: chemotaxis protein CheA [Sulfitobacter sp.]|nr:chemotaxis protein CheA [Sulfitobacter sp.]